MENYNSSLKFNKYIVNEVLFKSNEDFKENQKIMPVNLRIVPDIKINKNFMYVTLLVEIFKDSEENNYPFEMSISLTGEFEAEGEKPESFKRNAIAILYPYVRAMVSVYTANANINPLILPAINVNKLIEDQEKKKQED